MEVFVCHELCTSDDCKQLLKALAEPVAHRELLHVSSAVFAKLAFGERADGVVGIAKAPSVSLAGLTLAANPIVAVLEGVEKPGNVGAVLRSADAAGVSARSSSTAARTFTIPMQSARSLGTIFTVPVCTASSGETLDWLRRRGLAIYAARVDAELDYTRADFTRPFAIVLGSEGGGAERTLAAAPHQTLAECYWLC